MYNDFIQIKSLDGELKISHKKHDFGVSISTKELVFQKPHVNYHIKLENIVSIVPFQTTGSKWFTFVHQRSSGNEVTHVDPGLQHYKFYVREAIVHNRSGMFHIGPMEIILPVFYDLLQAIAEYGGLNAVATGQG